MIVCGDRVVVYYGRKSFLGRTSLAVGPGIFNVYEDGFYSVHREGPFHIKQMRKLVKRNKIWLNPFPVLPPRLKYNQMISTAPRPGWLEFIGVKRKK